MNWRLDETKYSFDIVLNMSILCRGHQCNQKHAIQQQPDEPKQTSVLLILNRFMKNEIHLQ
jgi:hypothetical protein